MPTITYPSFKTGIFSSALVLETCSTESKQMSHINCNPDKVKRNPSAMTHKAGQAASLMQSQGADLLSGQQWRFVDGFQMFGLWTESKFAKKLGDGDINFQAYMILIIRNPTAHSQKAATLS
jgi:hypothetical protein